MLPIYQIFFERAIHALKDRFPIISHFIHHLHTVDQNIQPNTQNHPLNIPQKNSLGHLFLASVILITPCHAYQVKYCE